MLHQNPFDILGDSDEPSSSTPAAVVRTLDTKPVAKKAPAKPANFEQAPAQVKSTSAPSSRGGKSDRGRGSKPSTRGSRTQDKHSRSDRYDGDRSEKKEVAGAGSWGEPVQSEIDGTTDAVEAEEAVAEEAVVEEEEIEYKSLEQYMSERTVKKQPTKMRAANEGADSSKWKDTSVLVMKEDDFMVMSKVLCGCFLIK
jgi:hypothetical protein